MAFGLRLRLKDMHSPHNVLPADGALAHPLAALGAGHHVAALQQHAVDHCIHADPAQVVIVVVQLYLLTLCKAMEREDTRSGLENTSALMLAPAKRYERVLHHKAVLLRAYNRFLTQLRIISHFIQLLFHISSSLN